MDKAAFILVPLVGYVGIWLLAGPLFLMYFRAYDVPLDRRQTTEMLRRIPALLAIVTPPVCSSLSFFLTTSVVLHLLSSDLLTVQAWQLAVAALATTVVLDLVITVGIERIDLRRFPVSVMYALAWLVIVPAVVAAAHP